MNAQKRTSLSLVSALVAGLFAGAVMAGETVHESKMMFKLKTGDAEMIEADVSDMAVGESETFVTESGRTVDLLRTQDGMEVYLDGELLDMDFENAHGKHMMIHKDTDVECYSDVEGECEHDSVFIMAGDDLQAVDGDHVKIISKHVEVICNDDEDCEEMVWISDGDDVHVEEFHEEDGHKVIKIRTHKESGQD